MSALYSGIHIKLKNSKIPWEDKIKLAHFAWISHQCFLPNKEQVLLDWVCHALVGFHSKKLNLEGDVQQKLWCFLDSILRSKRLECLVKEGKSMKLRFAIAQVMNDFIALSSVQQGPPAGIAIILSCCQTVLSTPALAFVYTTKYELMVDLLTKLSTLASHCLNNPSEQLLTIQVLKILHLSFIQYLQVQRQQSNPNRIFTYVMTHLFQPCLLLRNTLNVRVLSKDDDSQVRHQLIKDIRSNIETVLSSAIFQPELLASYKEELLPERDRTEKKKISPKLLLMPVSSILAKLEDNRFCNSGTHVSLFANSVSLMYKLFLDSYCKDTKGIFCFHMLVKLFQCLESTIPLRQENTETSSSGYSTGLLALEQLLNLAVSHDIYNVAEDHIRHKNVQYQFYRKLAEMLICNPCTSSQSWFRCLKNLILLNHLIVEPDLDDLLSCAWIDADISDLRIRKAQEAFISSLLQTYTKLRQFPKLFQEVVILICRPAADELRQPILTSTLSEKLSDFLIQLPPNQILDVWGIILEKCSCDILPDIKDDRDVCLKLVSLSSLLHCLLFHMKSLDNYTPLPVIARFHDLMKQMMDKLILPSLNLVKEGSVNTASFVWLSKLCDAVLLLLCTWIEVNTVSKLNCNKYVSQIRERSLSLESSIEGWDFSVFCGDKDCWNKVYTHCIGSNPVSKFYLELLSIHKMKNILMHFASTTESMQLTLQNAAFLIIHPGSDLMVPKDHKPWSGNANIVDTSSFHVAHWHLIATNLLIILPYIPLSYISNITDFLLETMPPAQYTKDQSDKESTVSFEDISMAMLKSDHFSELPVLQCAFITSIINKCAMAVKGKNILNGIFDFLSAKELNWHEDFLSSYSKGANLSASDVVDTFNSKISGCVTNLEVVVQSILSMTTFVEFCDSEINHLTNVLEFISAIKPDSLTPSDQCRCFFLLLSIARATCLRSLQLAGVCYRLMVSLLNGKHAKSLFKLLFASDILKTVMMCFQTSELDFADDMENKQYWPEFVSIVQSFFETLLALVLERKQSCLLNLEKFAEFVFQFVPNPKSKDWNSCIGQLLISVLSGLCRVLTTCVQEHIVDKKKTETFVALLQQTVVTMNIVVQQCLKVSAPSQILPSFLVSCTTTLLEAELSCQDKIKAKNIELYRSISLQILRELPYAEKQTLFLKAAFRYLVISITVEEIYTAQQMLVSSICNSVKKLLSSLWINTEFIQTVERELLDLFSQLMERCSCEEFNTVLHSTLQGLEVSNLWKNSDKEIVAGITITKLLLNCPLKEDKGKVFWFTASQIMTALVTLGNEACKNRSLLTDIVVPVVDTMALLLRRGELYLINPHHVTLSLRTLLAVPLDHLRFEEYYSIFLAVHEVLFSILQCHSKVMLKSVAPFLSTFHRLVSSVMHEGQQKGDKGTANDLEIILKCAQLVERMYSHIAAKTEEFTVFSAFMVSQYVNELQKVTLQPAVKKHLTGGIFHILDLCIDRDIKFLNASLQMGVREVFKELYQEYTHQHRTRNQVEEKYTVL